MIHESQSVKTVADVVTSVFAYSEFVYLKFKNEQSYYMYCLFYDESCIFEYFFCGSRKKLLSPSGTIKVNDQNNMNFTF